VNVKLLRKISDHIQANPELFNMARFAEPGKCGTMHCIGGWAAELSGKDESVTDSEEMATLLEIDRAQAERLFYAHGETWERFGCYDATAEQAAARIEHFIATDGAE
jgi:hypothetical protein